MADLVARLRLTDVKFQRTEPAELQRRAWEAADAIEFLEARAESAEKDRDGWRDLRFGQANEAMEEHHKEHHAQLDSLLQAAEEAREALERISAQAQRIAAGGFPRSYVQDFTEFVLTECDTILRVRHDQNP